MKKSSEKEGNERMVVCFVLRFFLSFGFAVQRVKGMMKVVLWMKKVVAGLRRETVQNPFPSFWLPFFAVLSFASSSSLGFSFFVLRR